MKNFDIQRLGVIEKPTNSVVYRSAAAVWYNWTKTCIWTGKHDRRSFVFESRANHDRALYPSRTYLEQILLSDSYIPNRVTIETIRTSNITNNQMVLAQKLNRLFDYCLSTFKYFQGLHLISTSIQDDPQKHNKKDDSFLNSWLCVLLHFLRCYSSVMCILYPVN